ncbi:MAG: NAD(+)/NADH kinase [bacterium]
MNIGLIINPTKTEVFEEIRSLIEWLDGQASGVYYEPSRELDEMDPAVPASRETLGRECDVVAVFGGDGTLLDASHEMVKYETPIIGVNTGGLGFLTETTLDEIKNSFKRIFGGNFEVQERMMVRASQNGKDHSPLLALNDVVLSRYRLGRVVQVEAYVDDSFVTTYDCDGMIVSTPTGSTAYNLSANGPIVNADLESIILNPICPHTLTNRPLILPPDSSIRLEIKSEDRCQATADGQDRITDLGLGDEIVIEKAERTVTLIDPEDRDFYNILREKLHWSGRTSE